MGRFTEWLGIRTRRRPIEREEPSLGPTATRSFQMARSTRLTSSWTRRTGYGDANQEIYADHSALLARAREQSINNGYAKRFYRLLKQNVIGSQGIQLMSKAVTRDGQADRVTRKAIELEWWRWCKRGQCEVTRSLSFWQFQRLWLETLARDGEVMVRRVRNFKNRHGFALQILEVDRLDLTLNQELSNGNRIRMGVERDRWEAPVAYWLLKVHPGDVYRGAAEEKYDRVPVEDLRHSFDPWRPHQSRGFTWTHASALDLHHLGEYRGSELIAAEMGAKITGIYEQDLDARLADVGLERLVLAKGDPSAYPVVPPTLESDDAARLRYYLAPHAPAAGSRMQYRREILTLGGRADVSVDASVAGKVVVTYSFPADEWAAKVKDGNGRCLTPGSGQVTVTVLAREGTGAPNAALLDAVRAHFAREDVRPETDQVIVQGATVKPYKIRAIAYINPGPDASLTASAATTALQAYADSCHRLEARVEPSWIDYTLHNAGAVRLQVLEPAAPIVCAYNEAPYCTGVEIEVRTL